MEILRETTTNNGNIVTLSLTNSGKFVVQWDNEKYYFPNKDKGYKFYQRLIDRKRKEKKRQNNKRLWCE